MRGLRLSKTVNRDVKLLIMEACVLIDISKPYLNYSN